MNDCMHEWTTEWKSGHLDETMNDWMNEQLNEWRTTEWNNKQLLS